MCRNYIMNFLRASVVGDKGRRLGGPWPGGPAINDGVCDAITMAQNEQPHREKLVVWLRGVWCVTVLDLAVVDCHICPGTPLWLCKAGATRAGEGKTAEQSKKTEAHNL